MSAPLARAFDGQRAMELLRAQCGLGPRVPGTPGHEAGRRWIVEQLKSLGFQPVEQSFAVTLPLSGQAVTAYNIYGTLAADGPTSPALLLSAHWDTRPWADRDPAGTRPPLVGANDGASGVAAVLELARRAKENGLAPHIAIAFWDAEDSGVEGGDGSTWALGARHAAQSPPAWIGRVALGINFDMVAGEDLRVRRESHSLAAAPLAMERLWQLGRALAPRYFDETEPVEITDDHLPWIERGLPYIDLIGWPYRYWHTAGDTPEHCRTESLDAVGEVAEAYMLEGGWRRGVARRDPVRN